jgi:hypothetical protein
MKVRYNGHYYSAPLGTLLECLDTAEKELAVLEGATDRPSAYNAKRKARVISKLKVSIRSRLAWHEAELRRGLDAGFAPSEHFEPRTRSVIYPKTRRAPAHA